MLRNPVKAMVKPGAGDLPLSRRAEQLSVSQFVELTNWVEEKQGLTGP